MAKATTAKVSNLEVSQANGAMEAFISKATSMGLLRGLSYAIYTRNNEFSYHKWVLYSNMTLLPTSCKQKIFDVGGLIITQEDKLEIIMVNRKVRRISLEVELRPNELSVTSEYDSSERLVDLYTKVHALELLRDQKN